MTSLTPVQEFYRGKTVFITGASGFMGKVLLEKLLYSCPELKEVIIVVRAKRGKNPDSRLEEMFKLPIFGRIKEKDPQVLKKVTMYQGDIVFDNLGLSPEAYKHVIDNTNIVFHMAATLKLEGNLKDAIEMNLRGTKRALDISKEMKKLDAFVHLSTAFCNCDQDVMYEKVYDFPHKPEDLLRLAEWMDVKTLDAVTPELLKPHPNTYTYSKRLAELLVRDHYESMPVIIARPSIVTPAAVEPLPGWVDNFNGPTGVMIGAAKGVIRSMLCNGDLKAEIIPVDIAVNGLIVIPYYCSLRENRSPSMPVFNITIPEERRRTWKWIMDEGRAVALTYPFEIGLWYPDGNMTMNKFYHWFCVIMFMWLPAYIVDFLFFVFRQPRFMVRVQTKIAVGLEVLQFFTTRAWHFKSNNFTDVYKIMSPEDRKKFKVNTDGIDDKEYMVSCCLGGRQYVMKEPMSSIPKSRVILKFLYLLDRGCKLFFVTGIAYWISKKLGIAELFSS